MNKLNGSVTRAVPEIGHDNVILDSLDSLVNEFERLLSSEMHLLSRGMSNGLDSIALAKQSLVNKISHIEPDIIRVFDVHSTDARVMELKEKLKTCRIENQSNHTLIMMELKHSKKSLDLLRSVLNMDDLSLYSERGEIDVKREKRKIGSA